MDIAVQREHGKIWRELAELRERINRSYGGVSGSVTILEKVIKQADFLVLSLDTDLLQERRFVPGWGLSGVDGGANADYDLAVSTGDLDARYPRLDRIIRMGATWTTYEKSATGLTAALAAATSGDVVWIPPDTYTGIFTVPEGAVLTGESRDNTVIIGGVILGDDSAVQNIFVFGAFADADTHIGVQAHGASNAYVHNVRIELEQTGTGATRGISVVGQNKVYIDNCHVECKTYRGIALYIDHSLSQGADPAVTDINDGSAPVTPEILYTDIDTAPPSSYPHATLAWRFGVASTSAEFTYFSLRYRAVINAIECWPTDYPIRTWLKIAPNVNNTEYTQYRDPESGEWTAGSITLGYEANANCGVQEEEGHILLRVRRTLSYSWAYRVDAEARMGLAGGEGVGTVELQWSALRWEGGVHINDCYFYGNELDIYAEEALLYFRSVRYRTAYITLDRAIIIPHPGDRSAWDTTSYPALHAKDISDGTPVYHWLNTEITALADTQIATHAAVAGAHQDLVTLDANADTLLSLTVQALGLDTQVANTVLAGPAAGVDAVPTMRALVSSDLPSIIVGAAGASLPLWSYAGVDGTARTVVPGGAADVARVGVFMYTVYAVTGTDTRAGTATIKPGDTQILYTDGTSTLALLCDAGGELTVQRTAGTDTFNVTLMGVWQ